MCLGKEPLIKKIIKKLTNQLNTLEYKSSKKVPG